MWRERRHVGYIVKYSAGSDTYVSTRNKLQGTSVSKADLGYTRLRANLAMKQWRCSGLVRVVKKLSYIQIYRSCLNISDVQYSPSNLRVTSNVNQYTEWTKSQILVLK